MRLDVIQQALVVRDDEDAELRAGKGVDPFRHRSQGINVEAGVCLVENGEFRLQHGELQDFDTFLFPTRKALVQVAARKCLIDAEVLHLAEQLAPELAHRHQRPLRGSGFPRFAAGPAVAGAAHGADRTAQEIRQSDAGNGGGVLESEEQAAVGAFVNGEIEQVFTVQKNLAGVHAVLLIAHQGVGQSAFARAVGSHQGVNLSLFNLQVQAPQDGLVVDTDLQVPNTQVHVTHFSLKEVNSVSSALGARPYADGFFT